MISESIIFSPKNRCAFLHHDASYTWLVGLVNHDLKLFTELFTFLLNIHWKLDLEKHFNCCAQSAYLFLSIFLCAAVFWVLPSVHQLWMYWFLSRNISPHVILRGIPPNSLLESNKHTVMGCSEVKCIWLYAHYLRKCRFPLRHDLCSLLCFSAACWRCIEANN